LWAFFFAAGYWWIPFALAWIFQLYYIKRKRIIDMSGVNLWLSTAVTVLLGLWTRYVYYGYL
ncbi:MAG TPA: hypothetical protein VJ417_05695, partial [Candidatus Glassbacteria bacterium]|nr:hypothetical protein [Candidatus Glassbacteria bacterium]